MAELYLFEISTSLRSSHNSFSQEDLERFNAHFKLKELEQVMLTRLERQFPPFLRIHLKLQYNAHDSSWSGLVEIADWYDQLGHVTGLHEYLSEVLQLVSQEVMAQTLERLQLGSYQSRSVVKFIRKSSNEQFVNLERSLRRSLSATRGLYVLVFAVLCLQVLQLVGGLERLLTLLKSLF